MVLVLAATSVIALAPASAVAAHSYHRCRGGYDPDGTFRKDGGEFYRGVRELGTTCSEALSVVHGYVLRLHDVAGSLDGKTVHIGAYTCTTVSAPSADEATCRASRGRRVKFYGAP
jgi:hypothetical protein